MINEDAGTAGAAPINWYRSAVSPQELKQLLRRSDLRGWIMAGGYLAILWATASAAIFSFLRGPWWSTLALTFAHGMASAFLINGVHELNHGTVFTSTRLNRAFSNLFAFIGWINHDVYLASHIRHHRYTLHPPKDLEVVLPIRLGWRDFLVTGFVNAGGFAATLRDTCRFAQGRFEGEWEPQLFPLEEPALRQAPVRWARMLIAAHAGILVLSLWSGLWIIPLLISMPRFYGSWLFFLCNNTQHIALQDNVADFRLCCRTFTLNPLLEFLYWHMNYHTEHHMYPGVPCYQLAQLHNLIRGDMPNCAHGLVSVWRQIDRAQTAARAASIRQPPSSEQLS